jgi:multiple sugar transport system permease protein
VNNIYFTIVTVPLTILLALIFACILNKYVFFKNVFRATLFLPYIVNIVAVCYVWMMLFQSNYGPINAFLRAMGIKNPPGWLGSAQWAMPTIMLMQLWINVGYCMVIYLAGLQQIPTELNEVSKIDGATHFKHFRYVVWPLLSPTTFFIVVTMVINSFKIFSPVNIMTDGGPGSKTTVLVFYTYITAFRFYKMGYASAVATVLFIIIFIITYIQWHGQKKWIDYM